MFQELILMVIALIFLVLWLDHKPDRMQIYGNLIPGPKTLPFVGNALTTVLVGPESFDSFMDLMKDYGKTFRLWIGSKLLVFVCDKADIQMLLTNPDLTAKATSYSILHNWLGTGLLSSSGELWYSRRKAITPAFHFKILEDFVPTFNKCGKLLISILEEEKGQVFDIEPYLTAVALDAISESAMGISVNALTEPQSEYVYCTIEMTKSVGQKINFPWLGYEPIYTLSGRRTLEKNCIKHLQGLSKKVLKEKKKELEERGPEEEETANEDEAGPKRRKPFLERLLEIKRTHGIVFKDDQDVLDEVTTFMFEGHDTTSSCLAFTVWLLGKNIDVQDKVYSEVSGIISEHPELRMEDLNAMKYLEKVIKESLRLYPPVPIIGRSIEKDTQFPSGYMMPTGAQVHVPIYVVHRDPDNFPEPLNFDPDRFDEQEGISSPFVYIPFSAGSRNCIGQKFVMLELKALLSMIVYNFAILAEKEVKVSPELILRTEDGVYVSLVTRKEEKKNEE